MYRKKLTILETPKTDTWAGTSDCGHRHSVNTWEHKHLYLNIIPHSLPHGSLSIVTQNHIRGEYGEQQKLSTSPFFLPQFSPSISRDAVPLPMEEKGTSFSRWTSQSHCSSLPNGRGELPSCHRRSLNPHSEGQKRIQTFWWWELSFSNSHQYYYRIIGHLRQLKTLIQDSSPLLFLLISLFLPEVISFTICFQGWVVAAVRIGMLFYPVLSPLSKVSWRSRKFTWLDNIICLCLQAIAQPCPALF